MQRQLKNAIQYFREFGFKGMLDIVKHGHSPQIAAIRVKNYATPFLCRMGTADFAMLRGVIGRRELKFPMAQPPRVIVDAGANVGYATRSFKSLYPDARIIAIEPDEANCELFRKNVPHSNNVRLIQGGLWSRDCNLRITNPDAEPCSFRVEEVKVGVEESFPGVSPQTLIQEEGRIDLFKIDIEGAESMLFGTEPLNWLEHVGVIAIEIHDNLIPGLSASISAAVEPFSNRAGSSGEYTLFELKG